MGFSGFMARLGDFVAYIILLILGSKLPIASAVKLPFFIINFFVMTGVLIVIFWKKGEKIDFRANDLNFKMYFDHKSQKKNKPGKPWKP